MAFRSTAQNRASWARSVQGDINARYFIFLRFATLSLGLVFTATAVASEESQLVDSINNFRNQSQRCGDQVSQELPPLNVDTRLVLSATSPVDLQEAMARATYPMVNVRAISLSGPRDAQSAMNTIQKASAASCSTHSLSISV